MNEFNTSILESLGADVPMPEISETPQEVVPATGNIHNTGTSTSIEERALVLLGAGVQAEQVATTLGVLPSRISQLLSQEDFAHKVQNLRYENLQRHNKRDSEYDSLEDALIGKLNKSLPLMVKPETILRAISTINSAKRRGQSSIGTRQ